ncbi:MAG: hypothetical protein BWK80_18325 [Desulfobacteraceae bacterium IS3]|nr:MAG: hypothetical protein BWK80_18325 [Desulfobacteraceae bacterium IS3]
MKKAENSIKRGGYMQYSVVIPDTIAMQLEKRSENVSRQFAEALAVQKYRMLKLEESGYAAGKIITFLQRY